MSVSEICRCSSLQIETVSEASVGAARDSTQDVARPQHYLFAHRVLPARLWDGDGVLGILENPENQTFLTDLWDATFKRLRRGAQLDSEGLGYSVHWIGEAQLAFLIRMPAAVASTEAHYTAITTWPVARYFTLEFARIDENEAATMFCEWTPDGLHQNYSVGPEPTPEAFLKRICRHLKLPSRVEAPGEAQRWGVGQEAAVHADWLKPLPERDQEQVDGFEQEAWQAEAAGDYAEAERLYRQILDIRTDRQGPGCADATTTFASLIMSLTLQGKYEEAEQTGLHWWGLCRRFRMLGHAETLLAMALLADVYQAQGRAEDALALMRDRAQLSGLTRGKTSLLARQTEEEEARFLERVERAAHKMAS